MWWKRGSNTGVLVDAQKAAEIQRKLERAIEDLQETLCEVHKYIPPDSEEDANSE